MIRESIKLSNIIKEIRLTRKYVPNSKIILSWLKGTEFDIKDENTVLTVNSTYDYNTSRKVKAFIENAIKVKLEEKKAKNKLDRIYFYISIGGTPELTNQFKIEVKDHLTTRTLSPKGCDKYCTENQIGKPQNWVKLPVILLPDGNYFDIIRKYLNECSKITKVSNDIYLINSSSFINTIKEIRTEIFNKMENNWFCKKYDL